MITETTMYWILKLDDIRGLINLLIFTIIMFSFISIIIAEASVAWTRICKDVQKIVLIGFISIVSLSISKTFIPTTKQMLLIKAIPAVSNCALVDEMSKDVKDFYKLGLNALKEKVVDTQSIAASDKN